MNQPFERREEAGALWIRLKRPPVNVLDVGFIQALDGALLELPARRDLKVLVLESALDGVFSAGVDVAAHARERAARMLEVFHGLLRRIDALPQVALAAVDGSCLGGGCELAASCDVVLATPRARFGQPEIDLGCYPPYAAALYPALLGPAKTLDLLVTGRILGCEEAERMGLVARRVPKGGLDEALTAYQAQVEAKSTAVVRLLKKAVRAGRDQGFATALPEAERIYIQELCKTEDMAEGLGAFLEKRPPVWRHR